MDKGYDIFFHLKSAEVCTWENLGIAAHTGQRYRLYSVSCEGTLLCECYGKQSKGRLRVVLGLVLSLENILTAEKSQPSIAVGRRSHVYAIMVHCKSIFLPHYLELCAWCAFVIILIRIVNFG